MKKIVVVICVLFLTACGSGKITDKKYIAGGAYSYLMCPDVSNPSLCMQQQGYREEEYILYIGTQPEKVDASTYLICDVGEEYPECKD
jgi:hypothetical protein